MKKFRFAYSVFLGFAILSFSSASAQISKIDPSTVGPCPGTSSTPPPPYTAPPPPVQSSTSSSSNMPGPNPQCANCNCNMDPSMAINHPAAPPQQLCDPAKCMNPPNQASRTITVHYCNSSCQLTPRTETLTPHGCDWHSGSDSCLSASTYAGDSDVTSCQICWTWVQPWGSTTVSKQVECYSKSTWIEMTGDKCLWHDGQDGILWDTSDCCPSSDGCDGTCMIFKQDRYNNCAKSQISDSDCTSSGYDQNTSAY